MGNFYTDVILHDPRFHSTDCIRDPLLLEPVTRAAVAAIIEEAAAQGIHLQITETYRSPARQAHLFATGATQLKEVGVHGFGLAADFCKIVDGKASWGGDWAFLRDLAVKHGMISGYDWGTPDKPHTFRDLDHMQRIRVEDQHRLFELSWYPDSTLPAPPATVVIS